MLGPHTVQAIPPGGRDEWGDTIAATPPVPVGGCFWQPVASGEDTDQRDTVTITARCFMPAEHAPAGFDATWRLAFEGTEYEIHGRPNLFHRPLGPHHYEIQLRDVRG